MADTITETTAIFQVADDDDYINGLVNPTDWSKNFFQDLINQAGWTPDDVKRALELINGPQLLQSELQELSENVLTTGQVAWNVLYVSGPGASTNLGDSVGIIQTGDVSGIQFYGQTFDKAEELIGTLAYELGHAEDPENNTLTYDDTTLQNGAVVTGGTDLATGAIVAEDLLSEGKSIVNNQFAEQQIFTSTGYAIFEPDPDPIVEDNGDTTQAVLAAAEASGLNIVQSTTNSETGLAHYWAGALKATRPDLVNAPTQEDLQNIDMNSASSLQFDQESDGTVMMKVSFSTSSALEFYIVDFGKYGLIVPSGTEGGQNAQKKTTAELKALKNPPIIDLAPAMDDFADAAAIVAQLDLVIMTDSAIAHLAGALGKPVWVLLNRAAYWLWLDEQENTLWHNSLKLIRQKVWSNWIGVLDNITKKLLTNRLNTNV